MVPPENFDVAPSDGIAYRIWRAEREIEQKADREYVDSIATEIRSLRKIVLGFMATTAGAAILVSFTLFATVGSHLH